MARNDRTIRVLLGVIALLLAGNLLVQLGQNSGRTAWAAGIPDTGAQNQAMIDQLVELNKKVDKLDSYLESGNLSVKIQESKKDK